MSRQKDGPTESSDPSLGEARRCTPGLWDVPLLPSAGNKPGQRSKPVRISSSQPAQVCLHQHIQQRWHLWGVLRGSTQPWTYVRGPGVPPSGTVSLHIPGMSVNAARYVGQLGNTQTYPATSPPGSCLCAGPVWVQSHSLTQGSPSACMQNGMENSPQTLQSTKNELALSAQVHTLDISVKASNFAVNYRNFPIKERQTGPKPQSYEKERTTIQNIQAFPRISQKTGIIPSFCSHYKCKAIDAVCRRSICGK